MKARIGRRPDGSLVLHIDAEEHPEAQVLYDLIRDAKPRPKFLVEGVEQARNPKHITADNPPFYEGDETVAQVTPDGVYIEHISSGDKMLLSHECFAGFVDEIPADVASAEVERHRGWRSRRAMSSAAVLAAVKSADLDLRCPSQDSSGTGVVRRSRSGLNRRWR